MYAACTDGQYCRTAVLQGISRFALLTQAVEAGIAAQIGVYGIFPHSSQNCQFS